MVKEDEMKWLTWLTLVACLCCIPLTATWADMEEIVTILASDVPEEFSSMVANARDVNGDGYHDLLIGTNIKWFGRAYIYFGGPSFDTIPDITLVARENIRHFGYCVSGAGDVNGDGFYDIMVAAGNEETDRSFVYILYMQKRRDCRARYRGLAMT
jgi:hypothetical protein